MDMLRSLGAMLLAAEQALMDAQQFVEAVGALCVCRTFCDAHAELMLSMAGVHLQIKLERLPDIARAFVHIDYETSHEPEHKIH